MTSENSRWASQRPNETADQERWRTFIQSRIPRLKAQIRWASNGAAVANIVVLGLLVLGMIGAEFSILCVIVIFVGQSILCAVLNLHVDSLSSVWRDLDRDLALQLDGFETPLE